MATPGGPLEICFSFDTTVSMTTYVNEVKAKLQDMVQRLKSDIPGIKLALFAHGDYYYSRWDNKSDYVTIHTDFTDDVAKLCEFIQSATPTNGGDWKECYELVLWEAREKLSWSPGANKVMVIIGDAIPHEVNNVVNTMKISWKHEVKKLLDMGVRTYGVFCKTPHSHDFDLAFYKDLAKRGQGDFLTLSKFDSMFDFIMAICYRENGEDALQAYEKEVLNRGDSTAREVNKMFTTLKKSASNASTSSLLRVASTTSKTPAAMAVGRKTQTAQEEKAVKLRTRRTRTAKTIALKKILEKVNIATEVQVAAPAKHKRWINTYKKKLQRRLRRELVPQTNFDLGEYRWSAWKPVFGSSSHGIYWHARKDIGYVSNWFFTEHTQKRALYEFAVQLKPGLQKTIVYSKLSDGFPMAVCWESKLLNSKCLRLQIDKLIEKEFTIHVRRLVIGSKRMHEKALNIHKMYDYAWEPNTDTGKSRKLVKKGETVSFELDDD